jgi:hypothetical protein
MRKMRREAPALGQAQRPDRCETLPTRKPDDAAFIPPRSCRVQRPSCAWDVNQSLRLCRSLLPLAFTPEKSSDAAGARLTARSSCAHPDSSSSWSYAMGLLRRNGRCGPSRATLKLHVPWLCAMHTGCTRPAGGSRSRTPPPVACARVTIVIV